MHEKEISEIFGLKIQEAKLYLSGLQYTHASLTELAKSAGMPRTAAYYPLEKLLEQGFFTSLRIGKRQQYIAISPTELEKLLDARRKKLSSLLSDLIPTIESRGGGFSVQYFPGPRGIEMASKIFLEKSKSKIWFTFEHPLHSIRRSGEKEYDQYIAQRIARKIQTKTIVPASTKESAWVKKHIENDTKELRETLLVSAEEYPIEASLATDGERVLLFDAKREPFATLVTGTAIAESFKTLHRIAWERYKK